MGIQLAGVRGSGHLVLGTKDSVAQFVVPESAGGGCPWFDRLTTLSGVEGESRGKMHLDTGSRRRLVRYDDCCQL